jgi:hypothetical protein
MKKTHAKKLLAGKDVPVILKRPDKTKIDVVCRWTAEEGLVVVKAEAAGDESDPAVSTAGHSLHRPTAGSTSRSSA